MTKIPTIAHNGHGNPESMSPRPLGGHASAQVPAGSALRRPLQRAWAFSGLVNRRLKFAVDMVLIAAVLPLALYLRVEDAFLPRLEGLGLLMALAVPLYGIASWRFALHRQSWGKISLPGFVDLSIALSIWTAALLAVSLVFKDTLGLPTSVPLIAGVLAATTLGGVRLLVRFVDERSRLRPAPGQGRRVLIMGAGEAGMLVAREMARHPESGLIPVAFLDDDPNKTGVNYFGLPVAGPLRDVATVAREFGAGEVMFAIPSAPASLRREMVELARSVGLNVRVLPSVKQLMGDVTPGQIQDILHSFVDSDKPRNVLVIGGAGYIGSALVPLLLQRGYHVHVLDFLMYGTDPIKDYLDHPRFQLTCGDFRQVNTVVKAMQGVDTVIHLGGLVGDPACAVDEDLTIEINLMATKMIAEAAKGYGIQRFIFASTCSVYGASDNLLDEDSTFNPVSLYAKTKIASERVLRRLTDDQFAPTILRFATVYGQSGRTRFDLVVNLLTAKAVTEGKITLYGGDQWRPFIHVQDVAKAVLMCTEAPLSKVAGEVFNVGSDSQNYTLAQMAERIVQLVPTAQVIESGRDSDRRNYRVSFQKLHRVIGFEPAWTIERGIRQVHDAIASGQVVDYQDPRYSNVRYLAEEGLSKIVRREFGDIKKDMEGVTPTPSTKPSRLDTRG